MNALAVVPASQAIIHVPDFTIRDMQTMATAFAEGGMFGTNNPNSVLTLMLVAQAEGKHPAQVLQDYDIIKGKPAKKAQAMLRDFLASGGRVEWHDLSDDIADATFSHPAGGTVRIAWDNERVKQAGLAGNDNHRKFGRAMKRSRVVSEGVRTVFPGATGGFYVPEEVRDFDDGPTRQASQPKRVRDATPADKPAREIEQPAQIEQPTPDPRQDAMTWTAQHIDDVMRADDAAYERLVTHGAKGVARLATEHPDLHSQVQDAYDRRDAGEAV